MLVSLWSLDIGAWSFSSHRLSFEKTADQRIVCIQHSRSQSACHFHERSDSDHSANHGHAAVLLQKIYSRSVPIKARTAAAVVGGLNEALNLAVIQFATDAPVK